MKIPIIFGYDVIHGFRSTFPVPIAEASSWNPELVEKSARYEAMEASASGIHWTFSPMVDIARDPRWGRIMEGSGEDPSLLIATLPCVKAWFVIRHNKEMPMRYWVDLLIIFKVKLLVER